MNTVLSWSRFGIACLAGVVAAAVIGIWLEQSAIDLAIWVAYSVSDDTLVAAPIAYATMAAVGAIVPAAVSVLVYVILSARQKHKEGMTTCGRCGYILKGLSEPRCPECGQRF